jgi:adenine/guanine phosphoribosyltransferase-like PRPP-binding protein
MIYHVHKGGEKDVHTLSDLDECVRDTVKSLAKHLDDFDTIVAQGMSGVTVASPVSLILKKNLTIVRKEGEHSHQYGSLIIGKESVRDGQRCLFLDDFVSMGDTRNRVTKAVEEAGGTVVAVYTYMNDEYGRR